MRYNVLMRWTSQSTACYLLLQERSHYVSRWLMLLYTSVTTARAERENP